MRNQGIELIYPGHIRTLKIQNFKSIKSLELEPKRVNLFIGKPNTGKSNVLEALSLLETRPIKNYIRFRDIFDIFWETDPTNKISITTELTSVSLFYERGVIFERIDQVDEYNKLRDTDRLNFKYKTRTGLDNVYDLQSPINYDLGGHETEEKVALIYPPGAKTNESHNHPKLRTPIIGSSLKYYKFKEGIDFSRHENTIQLLSPFGDNLSMVYNYNKDVQKVVNELLYAENFSLIYRAQNRTLEVISKPDSKYLLPLNSLADTFLRQVFFLTAIHSNKQKVLAFEEPEAHTYPPFIKQLALEIAGAHENQFFIATHSPYLAENLWENLDENELQVYVVSNKGEGTEVNPIPSAELGKLIRNRTDLFFNLSRFS
ncbi:MAG: AAA family ATPase [Bacteroidia bacterium]|nr:AAA family ATPase [Bacteroidia bacterium]